MMEAVVKEDTLYRKIRGRLGRIDTKAGRTVFGDDNPLTRHIRYGIQHQAIKFRAGYKPQPGPRLFKPEELSENGYIIRQGLYDPKIVQAISQRMAKAFQNPNSFTQRDGQYSLHLTKGFADVPEVRELLLPSIVNALSDYYGAHTDIGAVNFWRNLPPDENAPAGVYSSSWHTDRRSPTMMKLFYLVNDTTEDDGPFHIMTRGHTRKIIRTEYTTRLAMSKLDEDRSNYYKLTGKAGDILIGNTTMCLHKAGLPAPGHYRDLIQFQFFPKATPLPENWFEDMNRCRTGLGAMGL